MSEFPLTIALMIWIPLIPLRLAIQAGINLWKRLGEISSLIFLIYWAGLAILIHARSEFFSRVSFDSSNFLVVLGTLLIISALGIGYWTIRTLGWITLFMRPQLYPDKAKTDLIIMGPYRYLRHPFYFAEWLLLSGLALVTGYYVLLVLLILAIGIDPIVTLFEERELLQRFGQEYSDYQKKVPRIIPCLPTT